MKGLDWLIFEGTFGFYHKDLMEKSLDPVLGIDFEDFLNEIIKGEVIKSQCSATREIVYEDRMGFDRMAADLL